MKRINGIVAVLAALVAAGAVALQSCSDSTTAPPGNGGGTTGCVRTPLDPPSGTVVEVGTVNELQAAVEGANGSGNVTILVGDGTYELIDALVVTADGVTVRGASGRRDAVVLRGQGMNGALTHVFLVFGDGFTLADLTLGWAQRHAVELIHDNDDAVFHNVRFVDTGAHMLKVNYQPGETACSDNGLVEWCLFEYTKGIGPTSYIGGIDARYAKDWIVRHNTFRHIRSPEGIPSGFAVLFRSQSCGTTIDCNTIVDCDRGIGLGLGGGSHSWGLVSNNTVYTTRDVGMRLENALGTHVYCNTFFTENFDFSIEYRYEATQDVSIVNNLTSGGIISREGATGTVSNNVTGAQNAWFADVATGDLHLVAPPDSVIDCGALMPEVTRDMDCQPRPMGAGVDIGADEK